MFERAPRTKIDGRPSLKSSLPRVDGAVASAPLGHASHSIRAPLVDDRAGSRPSPPRRAAGLGDLDRRQPAQLQADAWTRSRATPLAPVQRVATPTDSTAVVQRTKADPKKKKKFNKSRVKEYEKFLRRRAEHRLRRGKNKPANKLLRKLRNAYLRYDPKFDFHLADPPVSGHHVPPLALTNKSKSRFAYGKRDSPEEKKQPRLYLGGTSAERTIAHGTLHTAEALMGLNRQGKFSGSDKELARRQVLAHTGLTMGSSGTPITGSSQSKADRVKDVDLDDPDELGTVTPNLLIERGATDQEVNFDIDEDDTDSEPDSDFENADSDSGSDEDSDEESEEDEEQ